MRTFTIEGKERGAVIDMPMPQPGPGEVRIRVDYVGICGSDLHYFFAGANGAFAIREPLTPGHELSGRIDLDPSGTWPPGTPVTVHPARFGEPEAGLEDAKQLWRGGSYLGSAARMPHEQGALAEYLVVDAPMVRPLPETLPIRRAVLAEPLAVALHGLERAALPEGASVLVVGAGPIGLLAIRAAKSRGAGTVAASDVLAEPLARAVRAGADRTFQVSLDTPPSDSFDVVLECSGTAAGISAAIAAVRRRGTVVQIGMVADGPQAIRFAPLISKEARLVGVFRFVDEIDAAIRLLEESPEIESVITHEFSLADVAAAFDIARDPSRSGKVILSVSGS